MARKAQAADKSILLIPNEPMEEYERYQQTYAIFPHTYFNPTGMFSQLHFLYYNGKPREDLKGARYTPILSGFLNPMTHIHMQHEGQRIIREEHIDLVRAFNPHVEGFHAVRLQRKTGVPAIVSYHNPYDIERKIAKKTLKRILIGFPIQRACEWYCNKHAAKILVVSSQLKRDLVTKGVPAERIEVIFNKVNLEKYRRHDTAKEQEIVSKYKLKGKKTYLFVGRFVEQKNIFTLLPAFKQVHEKDSRAHLLMVSDGPLRPQIERWIAAEGMQDAITLAGFQKNDDLPHFMHVCDAFVLPSWFEGFGIVLIEAQAAGIAVICSDIPHVRDIVNRENALLFDPKDVRALARNMQLVLQPRVRMRLVRAANKSVERFAWKRLEENDARLYARAIAAGTQRKP